MMRRALFPGCGLFILAAALPIAAHAGDWRLAKVRSFATRAEIDSAVNLDCAPARPDRPDAPVMVVSFRVGKSLRWRAVNLSAGDAFTIDEEIRINVADCRVERIADQVTPAASAP